MTRDRIELQRWQREAMARRVHELVGLRDRLEDGDPDALDEARKIGTSLSAPGSTFGLPEITESAGPLEVAPDEEVLRRVEGLIRALSAFAPAGEPGARAEGETADAQGFGAAVGGGWLSRAAGVAEAELLDLDPLDGNAWEAVAGQAGLEVSELARRVAHHFRLEVADLAGRTGAALRLLPRDRVAALRIVPLAEGPTTLAVATADPTALATEREIERLTGRTVRFAVASPSAIDAVLGELSRSVDAPGPGEPRASATVVAAAREPEPGKILVVDDEAAERLLVRSILEERGYSVSEAEGGPAALEAVRKKGPVGLVVADLDMPLMDGLELLWELRDGLVSELIPVMVVTSERDQVLESQLLEEGAEDYIRKPVDPLLLATRVEAIARRTGARLARRVTSPGNA